MDDVLFDWVCGEWRGCHTRIAFILYVVVQNGNGLPLRIHFPTDNIVELVLKVEHVFMCCRQVVFISLYHRERYSRRLNRMHSAAAAAISFERGVCVVANVIIDICEI